MANIMAMNIAMQIAMKNKQNNSDNEAFSGKKSAIKKLLAIAALLALACLVIMIQFSQAAVYSKQWQAALIFPTSKGEAAAHLSTSALAADEKDIAKTLSEQALSNSLTHVEALRTQGIIRFDAGETDAGKRLIELASELSWRDSATHVWLFERSLIDGNYKQSMEHADALLRRRRARDEIFSIFNLAAQEPQLAKIVVEKLAKNPPWRANYFAQSDQIPKELYGGFDNIILSLNNSVSPVSRDELLPYANMLAQNNDMARALKTWANIFPLDNVVVPPNGNMFLQWPAAEHVDKPSPASWRLRNSQSIYASVYNEKNKTNPILTLQLSRRAIGQIAERKLIIPAGKLTLQMTEDIADKKDFDKLRWFLKCNKQNIEIPFLPSQDPAIWTANVSGECNIYTLVLAVKLGGLKMPTTLSLADVKINHVKN